MATSSGEKITEWIMPYHKNFQSWAANAFDYSTDKQTGLFEHQKFVTNMFTRRSPYRGILLYHGLGVGKTRTAISIAEQQKRDVIVLLPASLKPNFEKEVKTVKGKMNYEYIHYNGLSKKKVDEIINFNKFANKTIIIDEVHNFISVVRNNSSLGKALYDLILNERTIKLICLSGTPVINDTYELVVLFNLIHGYIYNYRVNKGDDLNLIEGDSRIFNIDTSKSKPQFNMYPDGYIGEDNGIVTYKPSYAPKHQIESKVKKIPLFPFTEEEYLGLFTKQLFSNRIQGLVSYFEYFDEADFAKQSKLNVVKCPMSPIQYSNYTTMRIVEQDMEQKKKGSKKKSNYDYYTDYKEKASDLYRAFTRQICNFSFPDDIKRPYASSIGKALKEMDDDVVDTPSNKKEKYDNINEDNDKSYSDQLDLALSKVNTYENLVEKLHELSPKMHAIIENMNKSKGPVMIYSAFRNVEGLFILSKILDHMGYEELILEKKKGTIGWVIKTKDLRKPKYLIFENNGDAEKMNILLSLFNSQFEQLPPGIQSQLENEYGLDTWTNMHGEFIKSIMITKSGSEGISLKNIRQVHLLEPYWNLLRVRQVIGRGIRAKSHESLPEKERKVDVFLYLATFPDQNIAEDSVINRMESETTDEYIYNLSLRKDKLNSEYLDMIKKSAVDCSLYKDVHKIKKCYNHKSDTSPIPYSGYADSSSSKPAGRKKKVIEVVPVKMKSKTTGKEKIMTKNGKKIYQDINTNELYYEYEYKKSIGKIVNKKPVFDL
jgi:hypothetical protein